MSYQNKVNLGEFRVNLNQNLDKVVKGKGFIGKKKSMTSETMTKKWEIFK